MCAGRSGQLLNLSSLSIDCGVSHNTIKSWIAILEASFIVHLLYPHYKNFNKRLVKLLKLRFNKGLRANLYFWRDKTGHEIDCILDKGLNLTPIEIKSGKTITMV